jgi:RHS repeat-associated protein
MMIFRSQPIQRTIAAIVVATFTSMTLSPLAVAAQVKGPVISGMVGSTPLIPLKPRDTSKDGTSPPADAKGVPNGKSMASVTGSTISSTTSTTISTRSAGTTVAGAVTAIQASSSQTNSAAQGSTLDQIRLAVSNTTAGNATSQLDVIRNLYAQLKTQQAQMAAAFAATEAHINAHKLPAEILQRHQAAVADFNARSDALKAAMARLDDAASGKADPQTAINQLKQVLSQYPNAVPQTSTGTTKLPWGERKTQSGKVSMAPREFERLFPRSVQVAAAGSLSGISLPDTVLGDAVLPADLAATDDAPQTADIKALAASLNNNPVTIYNWVKNNIQFAPGYGAMQGAAGALASKRADAFDTASLLIALYRAAGIPARYVYGTIEVPVNRLNNWLGVDNVAAAQSLLTQASIPNQATLSGGQVSAVQLEHVWVKAFVDYSPSRGAINKAAQTWVDVDASFKQLQSQAGLDLRSAVSLNESSVFDSVKQGATCTADYGQNLNIANLQSAYSSYQSQLNNFLAQQGADVTVGAILGGLTIAPENYSILLGSLPYKTVVQGAIVNVLPDNLRWQFQLQLYANTAAQGASQPSAALTASLPSLAGKRITLSFAPATSADAATLASYMPKAHADGTAIQPNEFPASIPGYLINVTAELRVDGQVVASGGSFVLGSPLIANIGTYDPSIAAWNNSTFSPNAGDYQAIAIDAQGIGADQINAVKSRLNATQAKLAANQTAGLTRDDVTGDMLYQTALAYFGTADANGGIFQRASNVVEQRLPSYGRAAAQVMPQMVLGVVTGVTFPGVILDIDRMNSAVAASSNGLSAPAYVRQSNERNAAYAHLVLAKLFTSTQQPGNPASPVKALAAAATQGQQVYAVTSSNSATVLPQINVNATAKADLQNYVAAGNRALIAQNPVAIGGWNGQGEAIENPASGAGAYRLAADTGYATAALYPATGMGWLAQAQPFQSAASVAPEAQAGLTVDNVLSAMLGTGSNTTRWSFFPGQADVANGLFLARLAGAQGTQPCDSLAGVLAANLDTSTGFDNGSGAVAGTPVITSNPVTIGAAAQAYSYPVVATDPQGAALTYRLSNAPTGMTIASNGVITWTSPVLGTYSVTVIADNGKSYAQQTYQLTVSAQATALDATLNVTPAVINQGETVTINFTTTGGTGNIVKSLTVDGQPVTLNIAGQATVTGTVMGAHQITATAQDSINTVTKQSTYSVRNPADSTVPVAAITSPVDDAEVKAPVNIMGTASATNLAYYQLLLRPAGTVNWTEIARGTSSVTSGVLGKLDTTTLQNGIYELALNVVDANGNQKSQLITLDIFGDLKIGQFRISFQDLNVNAAGIPIRITRTYDTLRKGENLDFGYGWTVDYQSVEIRKNMVIGLQWDVVPQQLQICIRPEGKRKVDITLPDGTVARFTAANDPECAFGTTPPVNIVFTPLPGTTASLEAVNIPDLLLQGGGLYDTDSFQYWNPKDFKLTTEDNYVYYLTDGIGITQVKDPTGNTLTYGSNGIVHSNGQSVAFTRDAQNRITAITDPSGKQLNYTYSNTGDLTSMTDRTGAVSTFSYNSTHGLTSYTDPRGIMTARYVYDDAGRIIAAYDANGKAIELTHDTNSNTETVKDRMGNATIYTYDANGNVVKKVDALNHTTTYGYDPLGNEASTTDALNHTTNRTFDQQTSKQLSETDPLNNTISWTYDGTIKTQLNATTDALGNVTAFSPLANGGQSIMEPLGRTSAISVDTNGNMNQMSIAGQTTNYTYDAKGNKTSETDAGGNVITYAYDANNQEISRSWTRTVDGQNRTVTATRTLDANGRVISETDALGFTTQTQYNAGGQVTAKIDPQGRTTSYEYDSTGKLTKTTYPDGSTETLTYDANGNKATSTDRQGRTTQYQYDALNRLIKTIYADGSSTGTEYDEAGRMKATVDANNKRTTYGYDDANRLTSVTTPDLKTISYGYDANGNRTSVTDANLKTTTYKYDELNRLYKTIRPDGKTATIVWNPNNTKASETDFNGNTIAYGYDAMGRLNQVTQTNGITNQVTSYGFDKLGNKTSQTDAEGRTTTWTYDANNRVTSRTLPNGVKETFQYDAVGNMTAKVDFAGQTTGYGYTSLYQQNQVLRPDGAAIVTAYTASGQVASVTVTGGTGIQNGKTTYAYDAQDRLVRQTNPDGSFLAYAYDANGNIVQRSSPAGTVNYHYDVNQRLDTVTDIDGKQTAYTYDPTGKVQTATTPDGVTANYRYDDSGRLTQLLHVKVSSIVTGVRYTLSDNGQRTKIEEFDSASTLIGGVPGNAARVANYQYDPAGRLTQEQIVDRSGATVRTTLYSYDKVGNRIQKVETTTAGTETTNYSYDINDRLANETKTAIGGSQVVTTYTWDANGNLKSKAIGTSITFYYWNADNRLIEIKQGATEATATSIAKYSYDADGNRVSKRVPNAQGDIVTTYLVDSTFPYAQTLIENTTQGQSTTSTQYTWGMGLIEQNRAGQQTIYHADGLGNIKALTDANGTVTDTYQYTAFGTVENQTGSTTNAYRYTAEYFDADIGLQYNRARWYDPNAGRFTKQDNFRIDDATPITLHRYIYAYADPVNYKDPSGYFGLIETAIASDIAVGISGLQVDFGLNYISAALNPEDFSFEDMALVAGIVVSGAIALKVLSKLRKLRSTDKVVRKAAVGIGKFPELSNGMTNAEVGKILKWGTGEPGVRDALAKGYTKADIEYFKTVGLSRKDIEAMRDYYSGFQKVINSVTNNPTPGLRSKLMDEILKLW